MFHLGLVLIVVIPLLRTGEVLTRLGFDISTGNVPGAFVNATVLSGQLAAQSPIVQKKSAKLFMEIAKQSEPVKRQIRRELIKALGKRGAQSTAKLVPGVDVAISLAEAGGYLREGKLDQAGIAALSGAVGWVPVAGDFVAAMLDMTNTAIDITRADFSGKPNEGPEIIEHKKQKGSGVLTNKAMDDELKNLGISKARLEGVSSSGLKPRSTFRQLLRSAK